MKIWKSVGFNSKLLSFVLESFIQDGSEVLIG